MTPLPWGTIRCREEPPILFVLPPRWVHRTQYSTIAPGRYPRSFSSNGPHWDAALRFGLHPSRFPEGLPESIRFFPAPLLRDQFPSIIPPVAEVFHQNPGSRVANYKKSSYINSKRKNHTLIYNFIQLQIPSHSHTCPDQEALDEIKP